LNLYKVSLSIADVFGRQRTYSYVVRELAELDRLELWTRTTGGGEDAEGTPDGTVSAHVKIERLA